MVSTDARERHQAERRRSPLHAQHVERDEREPDRERVQQHQPQRGAFESRLPSNVARESAARRSEQHDERRCR